MRIFPARLYLSVLLAFGSVGAGACARHRPPPTVPEVALDVEVSGCSAVLDDASCEVASDTVLRLFARVTTLALSDQTGRSLPSTSRAVEEGTQLTVTAPLETTTELRVSSTTPTGVARHTLKLTHAPKRAWLEETTRKKQHGDFEGALVQARIGEASSSRTDRGLALGAMARIELARGDIDRAVPLFRSAMDAAGASGRVSDAVDDGFALAYALHQRSHRYGEARSVLDSLSVSLATYPDGHARDPYYRGILDSETGDLRSALRNLAEAEKRASRLGLDHLARNARSARAMVLLRLGRAHDAIASLRALDHELSTADGVTPCERVELAINLGWATLAADEPAWQELERATRDTSCADPFLRGTALANLALAELRGGDAEHARVHLAEARRTVTEPSGAEQLLWLDLDARIALAAHDSGHALSIFERACGLARASLLREAEYSCTLGRAETLEIQGKYTEAVNAYSAAESILDDLRVRVPLGEGRASFLAHRATSARYGVDLLARIHRPEEAMALARASRARVLAGVERTARLELLGTDERARWEQALGAYHRARATIDAEAADDWRLPRDKLAAAATSRKARELELASSLDTALAVLPATPGRTRGRAREPAGSMTLVLYPVRVGWLALASENRGVASYRLGDIDPRASVATLSAQILGPIAAQLARTKHLRVLLYGPLRALDVHALLFAEAPLVARMAVEYPLDVRDGLRAAPVPRGLVGVVGDPNSDLPSARDEARVVAATMTAAGARAELFEGDRATSAAMHDLLARADTLHYAGHGVYAGQEGWESLLPLAAGGRLTIADVLALQHAPRHVVLSGCETARSSGPASMEGAEGLGLAQAFLIVGSDAVVAPVRPVRDAVAAAIARAFYEALPSAGTPAEALAHAQVVVSRALPKEDWASFRALSP